MIGVNCQGAMTNAKQPRHGEFHSADKQYRTRSWGASIVRHEDMDEADHVDNEIGDAHEAIHNNIVHFIA